MTLIKCGFSLDCRESRRRISVISVPIPHTVTCVLHYATTRVRIGRMATLHVRNVPEALYEQLRQQAERQGRSLSAEVIVLLEQALRHSGRSQAEILADIRRRRTFNPAAVGAPDSVTLIREDRER